MDDFKHLSEVMAEAEDALQRPLVQTWKAGRDTPPEKISGVPLSRTYNTFENFDLAANPSMGKALEACQSVAQGNDWCAFLAGGYGTGKTHLAIAAMNEYGMSHSYFWKVPDYLDWLKVWAFDKGYTLDELTRSYRNSPFLLVMDDLGVENSTDWANEQLYRILDARCDNRLPTILTTNVAPNRIDGRILSRYASGLVPCEGKDQRR